MQGDAEFYLAHLALQDIGILPSTLANMSDKEKAFIYASIQVAKKKQKDGIPSIKPKGGR